MIGDCFFYTKEELEFKKELRGWLEEKIAPLVQPAIAGDYDKIREALKLMAKRDLLGAIHSKEYGGTEKGVAWESIIAEEVARINGAIEMTRLVSATLFGVPIAKYAKPEVKKKYIPKIIKGEMIGAIAMTEEVAGSDLARMQTQISVEGDYYVINGEKKFITNGGKCDILSVYGVLDTIDDPNPRKKITGLLVETKTPGFKVAEEYDLVGMEGASVARLVFDNVKVPKENLLGKEGQGFYILMDELNVERIGMAAACVGHAAAAFDKAVEHAHNRVQFKQPVYKFEGVSFRLAEAFTKIRAARLLTLEAARYIDAGDEETATIGASTAFSFATEMEIEVTNYCMQTLAGRAITDRTGLVACAWRMAPVMWTVGGTTDIQKFVIQREISKDYKAKQAQ